MRNVPVAVGYGLAAGVILVTVFFLPFVVLGVPRAEWLGRFEIVGYSTMFLAMTATVFAMRAERKRRGGAITFGAAFAVGVGVSLVAAVMFGLATWVFFEITGDALPELLIAHYTAQVQASGLPEAEIAARLQELQDMRGFLFNRPLQGVVMFATVFPIGVVESLVGAAFVRSRADELR